MVSEQTNKLVIRNIGLLLSGKLEQPILDLGETVSLTADQARVLGPVRDSFRRQISRTFLLHGVTGSGKTEIYLRAISEALEKGRQSIVLVPEITLTHQIVEEAVGGRHQGH